MHRELQLHQSRDAALKHTNMVREIWQHENALWADFQRCFPQHSDAVRNETYLAAHDFMWLVASLPEDSAFRRAQLASRPRGNVFTPDVAERAVF